MLQLIVVVCGSRVQDAIAVLGVLIPSVLFDVVMAAGKFLITLSTTL